MASCGSQLEESSNKEQKGGGGAAEEPSRRSGDASTQLAHDFAR